MGHFIEKCENCGKIISQCRCMSCDKEIRYSVCENCADEWLDNNLKFKTTKITGEDQKADEARSLKG